MTAESSRSAWFRAVIWSLSAGLVVLFIALGVNVALLFSEHRDQLRLSARNTAQYDLLVHHWRALEPVGDFRPVIDQLANHVWEEGDGRQWSIRYIGQPASPVDPDAFESRAIKAIQAGHDEVWEMPLGGEPRYVRAVRLGSGCVTCHPANRKGELLKAGDVVSIQSVQLAKDGPRLRGDFALNTPR